MDKSLELRKILPFKERGVSHCHFGGQEPRIDHPHMVADSHTQNGSRDREQKQQGYGNPGLPAHYPCPERPLQG